MKCISKASSYLGIMTLICFALGCSSGAMNGVNQGLDILGKASNVTSNAGNVVASSAGGSSIEELGKDCTSRSGNGKLTRQVIQEALDKMRQEYLASGRTPELVVNQASDRYYVKWCTSGMTGNSHVIVPRSQKGDFEGASFVSPNDPRATQNYTSSDEVLINYVTQGNGVFVVVTIHGEKKGGVVYPQWQAKRWIDK